jgi:hypothetical protein
LSRNKFGSVRGSFHGLFTLGKLFDGGLIDKMEDASAGPPSSSEIMHEIGISKGSVTDRIASWIRHVMRKILIGFTIDTM